MSQITYTSGRFFRDGKPLFLTASDYPYFRDRRENWLDRLQTIKASGTNCVTFYICWRHHLQFDGPRRWYDFTGRTKDNRDVRHYMDLIESLGLYMIVKPGPFIHSELNIGGLPDLVSPSFNPEMPALRRHHGKPAYWTYDASILPAPFAPEFDDLAREWLAAVGELLRPYAREGGPLVALQLNDETVYCTSNDPPWHIGYEPSGMRYFHGLLREKYGDIAAFNRASGTSYSAFDFVPGPKLVPIEADTAPQAAPGPRKREDLGQYLDWAEYQWRLRRDLYVRYKEFLGIDLPYLTNYAGITPPIEENVPNLQEHAQEKAPRDFARLYAEWWFAMNRVDVDAEQFHYGMISWLGVAAYDRDVFDRYLNTARRARGINMEENWGFGTLYDARSRDPIVPFFQTLVSIAGGATGYVIFVTVGTAYWDDTLDRTTKLQCPSFPSHAPIDEHGNLRPMYQTATMLNEWFNAHGEALLGCEIDIDVAYLLYAPYAAASSWIPDERYWHVAGHDIPRCGHEAFEPCSRSLQQAGYSLGMFELEAADQARLSKSRAVAMHSAFYMARREQRKLADFIAAGGRLFLSGELPTVDLDWQPCAILKEAVEAAARAGQSNVLYRRQNLFASGDFAQAVAKAGLHPQVRYSDNLRAYVHRGPEDQFVFFFNFDEKGEHDKFVEFYGQRLELHLGSKTSGVVRVRNGRIVAHLVKGVNETAGITADVRLKLGDQVVAGRGDFTSGSGL